ncbi:SRPBCC domain-containing protein [Patescibacteria group bacterium]|nr:SRPBCC domain-containing protein [Patescibacteria group bacterium]
MATITHRVEISASISEVYEVISTLGGLRSWWTTAIQGSPEKGGELRLGFGEGLTITLEVTEARKNKCLVWAVTSATFLLGKEWLGTKITFQLTEGQNRDTVVLFEHSNWKNAATSQGASATQWERSLLSLKKLCENGKGEPETPKKIQTKKASGWFPTA